jgi:hypothetical protein
MATTETYALPSFIADVDRIAREETDAHAPLPGARGDSSGDGE